MKFGCRVCMVLRFSHPFELTRKNNEFGELCVVPVIRSSATSRPTKDNVRRPAFATISARRAQKAADLKTTLEEKQL